MAQEFNNRVYGFAIIKSINSNYNADFSGQPRKLPNGTVYATDKALKYSIRNYWKKALNEKVFYFKKLNEGQNPFDLVGLYENHFSSKVSKDNKKLILGNLLQRIDVRVFGATFAPKGSGVDKKNISIHGPCQITHGVNRYPNSQIFTEQIMAPVSTPGTDDAQKGNTTLGNQSKLDKGYYVHHFSVNPKNIEDDVKRVNGTGLSNDDITKLKEGLRKGASYYDSAAKAGTENELLCWIQLKEASKLVLPSFIEFVDIDEKGQIDLSRVKEYLSQDHISEEIEKVEIFYNKAITEVTNLPDNAVIKTI